MPLFFQERADGYRVVRKIDAADENEVMIANLICRTQVVHPPRGRAMTAEEFQQRVDEVGMTKAFNEQQAGPQAAIITWDPLSRDQCSIHTAGGPLFIPDIEEMLSFLNTLKVRLTSGAAAIGDNNGNH